MRAIARGAAESLDFLAVSRYAVLTRIAKLCCGTLTEIGDAWVRERSRAARR